MTQLSQRLWHVYGYYGSKNATRYCECKIRADSHSDALAIAKARNMTVVSCALIDGIDLGAKNK